MTPVITVSHDLDADCYRLMATAYGRTDVAGPRILRATPHPEIYWVHETLEAAEADATRLRDYLAALPTRKVSKKKLREAGE